MHVRCSYCRQTFNLSREYVVDALGKAAGKKHKYHAVECINCRKQIKVPVAQMRHFVPEETGEDSPAEA